MQTFKSILGLILTVAISFDISVEGLVGLSNMRGSVSLPALFIVAWSSLLKDCHANKQEVEQHLEMGKKMLAAGQLADALSHYHAAVDGDPSNYLTYYRRATVYLAMGKSKSALPDLDKVIKLKPDFTAARVQRGNVKLKQGKIDDARNDFQQVLEREPGNEEARRQLDLSDPLKADIGLAYQLFEQHQFQGAIDLLGRVIEICPWDPEVRELRAECYIAQGDYFKAIGDIRPTTKLRPDNTAGYYKLSQLHYEMGEADESLLQIRECLKLDPDHKDCYPHYKKVKKLVKQMDSIQTFKNEKKYEECAEKAQQMQKTESVIYAYTHRSKQHLCHCYAQGKMVKEAFNACNDVLQEDENDVDALCDRAETYIANEQYEKAIEDFRTADGISSDNRKVQEGLQRAQKLLKQSKKRDYYKILGVKRNAKKKEILKAYRNLAQKYHPDAYDGDDKEYAEKMFLDIAAAKEVLTDPEKREKFDRGEDPLDAEEQAQQGSHGHPFFHGFNPFGQGSFNFKFHY